MNFKPFVVSCLLISTSKPERQGSVSGIQRCVSTRRKGGQNSNKAYGNKAKETHVYPNLETCMSVVAACEVTLKLFENLTPQRDPSAQPKHIQVG